MPFLPDSPFTIAYALILLLVVVFVAAYGDTKVRIIAGFMVLNWIGTRSITHWASEDMTPILGAVLDASTAILIALTVRRRDGYAVAALFGLMLFVYAGMDLGWFAYEQTWALVDIFAYLQILIMFAGGANGLLSRSNRVGVAHNGSGGADLRPSVSLWNAPETSDEGHSALSPHGGPRVPGTG